MPISKKKLTLHINTWIDDSPAYLPAEDFRRTIITIIMKSIESVTTLKTLQKEALEIGIEALENKKSISKLISAVFNAGLEDKKGLLRVLRGIKIFAIMSIEFILHGIGEFVSLLDRQVTNLLLLLLAVMLTMMMSDKRLIFINILPFIVIWLLIAAWKLLMTYVALAADILDLFTHSLTRLFDNWSHSPGIAFIFSLIPTLLLMLEFMSVLSLGAVGAIFAWPLIAIIAVGIGIGLLAGSFGVELAKPFEEIISNTNLNINTNEDEQSVNSAISAARSVNSIKNDKRPILPNPSATLSPTIATTNIDKSRALRLASAGAVSSTQKLATLDELLLDEKLQDFINNQDPNPKTGFTALHLAVRRYEEYRRDNDGNRTDDFYQKIKLLLQHDANYSIPDCQGKTAFDYTDDANNLCKRLENDGINNLPPMSNNVGAVSIQHSLNS